jgi:hypothetical protein
VAKAKKSGSNFLQLAKANWNKLKNETQSLIALVQRLAEEIFIAASFS